LLVMLSLLLGVRRDIGAVYWLIVPIAFLR